MPRAGRGFRDKLGAPILFPGLHVVRIPAALSSSVRVRFAVQKMKSNSLIAFVLMAAVVSSRAADTNQIAALAFLAAVSNAGNPPQPGPVATNKPAWESSISFGLTLNRGNSDTL